MIGVAALLGVILASAEELGGEGTNRIGEPLPTGFAPVLPGDDPGAERPDERASESGTGGN